MLPASVAVSYLIILVGERLFASGALDPGVRCGRDGGGYGRAHAPAGPAVGQQDQRARIGAARAVARRCADGTSQPPRVLSPRRTSTPRRAARRGNATDRAGLRRDSLKKINDNLGHAEGSEFLVDIATLLRETFRGSDVLRRIGGDEFAVVTHGRDDELTSALRRLDDATRSRQPRGPQTIPAQRQRGSGGGRTSEGGDPRRALGTCGRGDVPEKAGEARCARAPGNAAQRAAPQAQQVAARLKNLDGGTPTRHLRCRGESHFDHCGVKVARISLASSQANGGRRDPS